MDNDTTLRTFTITANGTVFGDYEGRDESEALEAYAKDAGYADYADLVAQHGEAEATAAADDATKVFALADIGGCAIQRVELRILADSPLGDAGAIREFTAPVSGGYVREQVTRGMGGYARLEMVQVGRGLSRYGSALSVGAGEDTLYRALLRRVRGVLSD
jgi:hypothetical protein